MAIPYGGADTEKEENVTWLQGKITFSATKSPRKIRGIATPVCGLARNDVRFIWRGANLQTTIYHCAICVSGSQSGRASNTFISPCQGKVIRQEKSIGSVRSAREPYL